MKLSIIMPAYNERATIREIIKKVMAVAINKELIIIDDKSTDGTRQILEKEYSHHKDIKLLYHDKNQGKGSALRTGLKNVTGEVIIIQDADLEYDPHDYHQLIKPILDHQSQVVYGSRFLNQPISSRQRWAIPSHYLGNWLLSLTTSILFFQKISDMETCYKMFTKKVLDKIAKLNATKFDFEPEITAKIIKAGYKIKEVPIKYYPRDFSQGKKINWKDGIHAILTLIKYRFKD